MKKHYIKVGKQLSLVGLKAEDHAASITHTVILPILGLHRGVIEALRYAQSIAKNVRAVYLELDTGSTDRLRAEWEQWGRGISLEILPSPYRSVISAILHHVDEVQSMHPEQMVTVLVPEFVTAHWWEGLFHNQTAFLMRAALAYKRNIVVTSVRYHLD